MSKISNLSNTITSVDTLFRPLEFNPHWVDRIRVNQSAAERRVNSLGSRRAVKKQDQIAWMLKAVSCIDLTTLSGDDTPGKVRRLCQKALRPISPELMAAAGCETLELSTAAVCVYHALTSIAVETVKNKIPVAAVSTGFPAGLTPMSTKLQEIEASIAAGASEIDIVVTRAHILSQNWPALYDEIKAYKEACGKVHMKTIIATGNLGSLKNVAKASMVAMMAGSDFIKTSTGMESSNANLLVSLIMVRMIREFLELSGRKVGFKPAGGIRCAKEAINYLVLMKEELGGEWLKPDLFRFGASSLLTDLERQIEFHLSGHYSANYRHPIG